MTVSILPDPREYQAVGGVLGPGQPYVSRLVSTLNLKEAQVFCCLLMDHVEELQNSVTSLSRNIDIEHRTFHKQTIMCLAEIAMDKPKRAPKVKKRKRGPVPEDIKTLLHETINRAQKSPSSHKKKPSKKDEKKTKKQDKKKKRKK